MNNIDWKSLPFGYLKTDYNVRSYYKNGTWSALETCASESVSLHMAATCLHYGQTAFEGLKALRGKDGKIRLFRPGESGKRFASSAKGIMMAPYPVDLFVEACKKVIKLNERFVPPYGEGASLYLRPMLIGTSPQVGVKPAEEYMFVLFVTPVGPYFKEGFNPIKMQIVRDFDRAAPLGTGRFKIGGNYAASLRATERGHDEGFSSVLFLDAKEKKYIDEAGPANFFGIKNNTYITPKSNSILQSITNMSLRDIARGMGMNVEERAIPVEELDNFEEVGACGTAAVISPIGTIVDRETGKVYEYCKDGKAGAISTQLYRHYRGIQEGEIADPAGWNIIIE
ncbi:MAG: branched-chain amino acid aminotransferase [Prevotellaceae bacterium]|jgi:branched-chain amino acid aminotransferase|nr:branched-chain amino acid aminotransferase [Prevotellaceae bacterium]